MIMVVQKRNYATVNSNLMVSSFRTHIVEKRKKKEPKRLVLSILKEGEIEKKNKNFFFPVVCAKI